MKTLRTLLALLLCLSAAKSYAENPHILRSYLESRLTEYLRGYDHDAYVVLDILPAETQNIQLIGTPFNLRDIKRDKSELSSATTKSIQVIVYTHLESLPNDAPLHVREILKGFTQSSSVVVKSLNKSYALKPSQDELKGAWPDSFDTVLKKGLDVFDAVSENFGRNALIGIGIGVLVLLSFLGMHSAQVWFHKKLVDIVAQGFRGVSTSLDTLIDTNKNGSQSHPESKSSEMASQQRITLTGHNLAMSLPDEAKISLFLDCYWTNNDAYGSFVWGNLSFSLKQATLVKYPFLTTYINYISENGEIEDLGYEQDPYYLKTLPLEAVSNDDLVEIVKANTSLYLQLPKMRVEALALSPKERLQILSDAGNELAVSKSSQSILGSIKSTPRVFKTLQSIPVRNLSEESELLTLDVPFEAKKGTPSLVWLLALPEHEIKEILGSFTARDLATAWIGPETVLRDLEKNIVEKKLEYMKSQLDKIVPSRNSPIFVLIHEKCMQSLERLTLNANKVEFETKVSGPEDAKLTLKKVS